MSQKLTKFESVWISVPKFWIVQKWNRDIIMTVSKIKPYCHSLLPCIGKVKSTSVGPFVSYEVSVVFLEFFESEGGSGRVDRVF